MFQTTDQSWNNLQLEKQTGRQGLHQLWGHFWRQKDADRQSIHQKSLDQDVQAVPQESFDDGCCASSWWSMMINDDWYDDWYGDNSSIFQLPEGYCERFNFYTTSGPFHAQFGLSQMIVGDPMPYAIQSKGKEPELTADPSSNTTKAPFHRQTGHEGSSVLHRPNCKPIPPVLQKEVVVGLPVGSGTENIRLDLQFANLPNSSNIYTSH